MGIFQKMFDEKQREKEEKRILAELKLSPGENIYDVLINAPLSEDEIRVLSKSHERPHRKAMTQRTDLPRDVFEILMEDDDTEVRFALASAPDKTGVILPYPDLWNKFVLDPSPAVCGEVVLFAGTQLSPETQLLLATSDKYQVDEALVTIKGLAPEVIRYFILNGSERIKKYILYHQECEDILAALQLIEIDDVSVRRVIDFIEVAKRGKYELFLDAVMASDVPIIQNILNNSYI